MHKNILLLLLGCSLSLTSCVSYEHESYVGNSWTISNQKLADGTPVKVGMMAPTPAWGCDLLSTNTYNWAALAFQSNMSFKEIAGGKTQILTDKALDYANQNNLKPNYIYTKIPSQNSINGVNLNAVSNHDKAEVFYYQCNAIAPK